MRAIPAPQERKSTTTPYRDSNRSGAKTEKNGRCSPIYDQNDPKRLRMQLTSAPGGELDGEASSSRWPMLSPLGRGERCRRLLACSRNARGSVIQLLKLPRHSPLALPAARLSEFAVPNPSLRHGGFDSERSTIRRWDRGPEHRGAVATG